MIFYCVIFLLYFCIMIFAIDFNTKFIGFWQIKINKIKRFIIHKSFLCHIFNIKYIKFLFKTVFGVGHIIDIFFFKFKKIRLFFGIIKSHRELYNTKLNKSKICIHLYLQDIYRNINELKKGMK